MWLITGRQKVKATDPEKEGLIRQNNHLKAKIVEMEKEASENLRKRINAEKRIEELETTINKQKDVRDNEELLKEIKTAIKEEVEGLREKKTNEDSDGSEIKLQMEEIKAQKDFYLKQTVDLSHFTMKLQQRLYDELVMYKGFQNSGYMYDLADSDRRLLMMHPVVLMTMFNGSPAGSCSSSDSDDSLADT